MLWWGLKSSRVTVTEYTVHCTLKLIIFYPEMFYFSHTTANWPWLQFWMYYLMKPQIYLLFIVDMFNVVECLRDILLLLYVIIAMNRCFSSPDSLISCILMSIRFFFFKQTQSFCHYCSKALTLETSSIISKYTCPYYIQPHCSIFFFFAQ